MSLKVIPELEGKLDGVSQRVPVKAGSLTELYTVLDKNVTVEKINATPSNLPSSSGIT